MSSNDGARVNNLQNLATASLLNIRICGAEWDGVVEYVRTKDFRRQFIIVEDCPQNILNLEDELCL